MAAPALQIAGAALGTRSLLPRAAIAAALALLFVLLLIMAPLALLLNTANQPFPDGDPNDPEPGKYLGYAWVQGGAALTAFEQSRKERP